MAGHKSLKKLLNLEARCLSDFQHYLSNGEILPHQEEILNERFESQLNSMDLQAILDDSKLSEYAINSGKQLFEASCAICHGLNGTGVIRTGDKFAKQEQGCCYYAVCYDNDHNNYHHDHDINSNDNSTRVEFAPK
jgi:hypothetical protein